MQGMRPKAKVAVIGGLPPDKKPCGPTVGVALERAARLRRGGCIRTPGGGKDDACIKAGIDRVADPSKSDKQSPEADLISGRRLLHLAGLAAIVACVGVITASRAGIAAPAPHESPHAYCVRVGTDDTLRPTPPSLAPAVKSLFNFGAHVALRATYYRCAGGDVEVCSVGANLPCDKANTRNDLPAAAQWCATHADAGFIPAYVTGHDSLYSWRCVGGNAEAGAPVGPLDPRGFFAEYWKTVK